MEPRRAVEADLQPAVETLVSAFFEDPTWAWAFPDPRLRAEQYRWMWTLYTAAALRQGGVWTTPDYEAVAVWIPPGGEELSPDEAHEVESKVEPRVRELLARFDAAHPRERPHWYLSLLGTHARHRGRGIGMRLLRHNLEQLDAIAAPAYLESSNSANDHRYAALGFERHGEFTTPDGSVALTTMWREPGA
jgi:GNAT superfamily N-acetyltransferase